METHFLGTSSGLPLPGRFNQTIALRQEGEILLIDPADGASSLLAQASLEHLEISGVVISHLHIDHHSGLPQVLKTMFHHQRQAPLTIAMPAEGIGGIQAYLRASYLPYENLPFCVEWVPWQAGIPVTLGTWQVTPYANTHLERYRGQGYACESYSLRIHGPTPLLYSGNVTHPQELDPYLCPGDRVIMELAHIAPEEVAAWVARHPQIGQVLITHIRRRYHALPDLAAILLAADPRLHLCHDGEVFSWSKGGCHGQESV